MSSGPIEPEDRRIPIGLLDEPTTMSRLEITDDAVEELAADIRQNGLINPIAVVPTGERYRVIAGHTRLLACQRAGLVVVRCSVYATEEDAADNIKFAENRYRTDLTPAEEATWFAELLEQRCDGDVDRLCALLKIKRSFAEKRLLLYQGDAEIFDAVKAGKMTLGVAEQLNLITDAAMRRYYVDAAIRGGCTVAVAMAWVAQWKAAGLLQSSTPAAPSSQVVESGGTFHDFNTCYVCREYDPRKIPLPVNIHPDCRTAILDRLLDSYHGTDRPMPPASDPQRI